VWLATPTNAQWHYEAISAALTAGGILGFVFEAYDEPWKNTSGGGNSEAHFGIWAASGTSSSPSQYTLMGETQKYPTS
jgi:exo-beta-1,3-glucanase (GH17 family)